MWNQGPKRTRSNILTAEFATSVNTKLPHAGHLAQIQGIVYSHLLYLLCDFTKHPTGAVLGYYKGNLCVDMTNLSYLGPSPSTSKTSPPSESQCTDSGPPRKRRLGAGTSVAITSG